MLMGTSKKLDMDENSKNINIPNIKVWMVHFYI
jgi:hypothetical protein